MIEKNNSCKERFILPEGRKIFSAPFPLHWSDEQKYVSIPLNILMEFDGPQFHQQQRRSINAIDGIE